MASRCSSERRSRTSLTLNQKLDMIKLSEKGMSKAEIGRKLGLSRQTVSQVVNAKEKFLTEIKNATPANTRVIRKQNRLIADMEKVLVVWIEDQTSHNVPLSQSLIQSKALTLFNSLKAERGEEAAEEKFEASRGWFVRFKERCCLCKFKVPGDAAGAKAEAAAGYPEDLAKTIREGGYTKQQIFNVDETALYWKRLPSRTFIAGERKSGPGFRASKDRLALLLGANAAGDCKLKPMLIYYSENPTALKNYAKSTLPVLYKWNNKAWMTAHLFTTWFTEYFKPTVETYCSENKIPFKILLLVDNAAVHPRALKEMYDEIDVIFMPAGTASILQPMAQGVISVFKSYYLRNTFRKAIAAVDSGSSNGSGQSKLRAFWKGFTILEAIKNIRDSWDEVNISTLTGVWKKLIPTLMEDPEEPEPSVQAVAADVVGMARGLELDVGPEDVAEWLRSHDEALTAEDWLLMDAQRKWFLEMESPGDGGGRVVGMTTRDLERYISLVDEAASGFERMDPNFKRSSAVGKMLSNSIACYRKIIQERKNQSTRQTSLLSLFKKSPQPPQPSATTTLISQQLLTPRQDPPPAKRSRLPEGSDDG
ncbi:tigger transposable element-derived protein 1 [Sturnira hondurensis]|uniref:tigger transposable element-derived protein 1 n=1 Tax=Sturnira hondurensis TaxID=192404 RepID=UPI0018792ADC|nr:tigger transposable element-derived protein 1 [Sturnira hondurensis]